MNPKRPVQYFSSEYLENCRQMTALQIVQFLEDYRTLMGPQEKPKSRIPISIRIPEDLLKKLKQIAKQENVPYQTKIIDILKNSI